MEAGPLNLVRPDVPVELAAVVAKMMAKEPRRRFQTPGEVGRRVLPFFKPAGMQPGGSNTEVSQVEQPVEPTRSSSGDTPPKQPVAAGVAAAEKQREKPKTVAEAVAWESLIEIKHAESSIVAPKSKAVPLPALARLRRPRWLSWKTVAAAALFGILVLGAIVYIRSDQGGPAVTGFPPEKHDAAPTQKGEAAGTADSEFAVAMLRIGAREFNGNYFKVYNDPVTWHAARIKCEKLGGHLAIVGTEKDNEFLKFLVQGAELRTAWLGATDEQNEGHWVWIDGSDLTYSNWDTRAGQPNNAGGVEHYVVLLAFNSGLWWDYYDDDRDGWNPAFICQWDGPTARTPRRP